MIGAKVQKITSQMRPRPVYTCTCQRYVSHWPYIITRWTVLEDWRNF